MFPQLLRKTLEKVDATQPDNIKSGFRTTGLIPLDRNAVIKRLPKQDLNNTPNDSATTIAETLKDLFQEARFGKKSEENCPAKTLKRKKLSVPAGKSVSFVDVKTTDGVAKCKKPLAKNNRCPALEKDYEAQSIDSPEPELGKYDERNYWSDGSENTEIGEPSSKYDICETVNSSDEERETNENTNFKDLQLNDFVIVELQSVKGRAKRFIGKIIATNPPRCSYLKQSYKIKDAFIFPPVPDEGDIIETEFVIKLQPPKTLRRGALLFSKKVVRNLLTVAKK